MELSFLVWREMQVLFFFINIDVYSDSFILIVELGCLSIVCIFMMDEFNIMRENDDYYRVLESLCVMYFLL